MNITFSGSQHCTYIIIIITCLFLQLNSVETNLYNSEIWYKIKVINLVPNRDFWWEHNHHKVQGPCQLSIGRQSGTKEIDDAEVAPSKTNLSNWCHYRVAW